MDKVKCYLLFLTCCLITISNFIVTADFKFVNCKEGESIAKITRFDVSPDPISLSHNITATVDIQILEDIPPNAFVKAKIYKITSFFGLHILAPCISGVGSCTTEHCKYLSGFKKQACSFFPKGVECSCPIKAGIYGGERITIPFRNMGKVLKWLASGNFKLIWQLITKEGRQEKVLLCYEFTGKTIP